MRLKHLIRGGLWYGAVCAAVGIGLVPGDYTGEAFCGVWGCFPPVQALLSLHLVWLAVAAPPVLFFSRRIRRKLATRVGLVVIALGMLVAASVVVGGLLDWGYSSEEPGYWLNAVRRAGYILAVRTDIPAFQLILVGVGIVMTGGRRAVVSGAPPLGVQPPPEPAQDVPPIESTAA